MAEFSLKLTQGGAELLAKAKLGKQLNFKYITLGSGVFEGNPEEATAFVNKVIDLNIQEKTRKDTVAFLKATLTYNAVPDGFVWTELGVIAIDPDTQAEVLYMYDAIDMGEVIPPATSATQIEKVIQVASYVSNAPNITAEINESLINIPKSDIGKPDGVAPLNANGVLDIEHGGFGGKTAQEALYNLGANPNDNLLDNAYFGGDGTDGNFPIIAENKRPVRWIIEEGASITLTDKGLKLTSSSQTGMLQNLSQKTLQNVSMTLSIFITEISGTLRLFMINRGYIDISDVGIYKITYTGSDLVESDSVYFRILSGEATILAARLEYGDRQTLGYKKQEQWHLFKIPNHATELTNCQKYYIKMNLYNGNPTYGVGLASTPKTLYVPISTPVTMIKNGSLNPTVIANGVSVIDYKGVETTIPDDNIICDQVFAGGVMLTITAPDEIDLTVGQTYALYGGQLNISTEI